MENIPMESTETIVSNIEEPTVVSEIAPLANETKKGNFTFKNGFLLCTSSHNRINRMGFFMNTFLLIIMAKISTYITTKLVVIEIILLLITLFFLYMICIQILKRCHDFGSKGYMILSAVIFIELFSIFGVYMILYLGYISLTLLVMVPIVTNISLFVLSLYLLFRPGNPEDNKYGKSFGL